MITKLDPALSAWRNWNLKPFLMGALLCIHAIAIPSVMGAETMKKAQFKSAKMSFDGSQLLVSTGVVERRWKVTKEGLLTVGLKDLRSNREWVSSKTEMSSDWMFDRMGVGTLVSVTAEESNDDGFAKPFLRVRAEFEYESLTIGYVIWAYPDATGLRTQVELKSDSSEKVDYFVQDRTDSLSFKEKFSQITAFGYRQGIKTTSKNPILMEKHYPWGDVKIDWANGLVLESENAGVIVVKESHKHLDTAKRPDKLSGIFSVESKTLSMTGCGYSPNQTESELMPCWANWIILYQGSVDDAQLALKVFDRTRYPVRPDHDIFIMANTWGSEDMRPECLYAAREENVLEELKSAAELGIDILQIDDGWQKNDWTPAVKADEVQYKESIVKQYGNYDVYPHGFAPVRKTAKELGVDLGLWAAWTAPLDKLEESYDAGNFKQFKLDFANLLDKKSADTLLQKARDLMKYSGYTAHVNWDVTERQSRMGYFYGREVGNIYLANRKTNTERASVKYYPREMLRNAWLLSKYLNLNKFQVTVANKDYVGQGKTPYITDYDHPYLVGIALMSSPIFFQETRLYTAAARKQVKSVLDPYKKHRNEMYNGYVFAIGDEPNDKNWTGFQCFIPESKRGYLTVFREKDNTEDTYTFTLNFIKNRKVLLTDLVTGRTQQAKINAQGGLDIKIGKAGRFMFLKMDLK